MYASPPWIYVCLPLQKGPNGGPVSFSANHALSGRFVCSDALQLAKPDCTHGKCTGTGRQDTLVALILHLHGRRIQSAGLWTRLSDSMPQDKFDLTRSEFNARADTVLKANATRVLEQLVQLLGSAPEIRLDLVNCLYAWARTGIPLLLLHAKGICLWSCCLPQTPSSLLPLKS